jgi:hypothetical protein
LRISHLLNSRQLIFDRVLDRHQFEFRRIQSGERGVQRCGFAAAGRPGHQNHAYLIDRERWQRDKPLLIERADLQAFLDPQQVLAELYAVLYQQYLTTNAHILEGQNPHIKFKKRGFSVSTPMLEESDAEALQNYFPERDFVPLMEVLATTSTDLGVLGL